MADLPDYYLDLGVAPRANQQEIDKVYGRRVAELRRSKAEDAAEELVEAAYAVLRDGTSGLPMTPGFAPLTPKTTRKTRR